MSKSPEDNADVRGGSEALLRAVRGDHEASAADYARVQAELARRIAMGATPKVPLDGAPLMAKSVSVFTPGAFAKLAIGLSLLAAGSFAIVRVIDSAPQAASRPASALAPAETRPSTSPEETPSVARSDADDPQTALRPAPTARVDAPHAGQREDAKHKRSSASHNGPARSDAHVANEATVARADSNMVAEETIAPAAAPIANAASAPARGLNPTKLQQPEANNAARPTALPPAAAALEPTPAPTEASARTSPKPQAVAVRFDDSADAREELALVERMHAALRAGKPAAALELSAEHAKRWPHGSLTEEREAVNAIASCVLRRGDATARARTFMRQYPHAPTAARVLSACAPLSAATTAAPSD